ncbi:Helicase conserved C-terminal domain-containing protein [Goodfellowiella coeruleoviolacea]|uniref:Helicase conserved C-terminal domain-containing protein n=2 Tax=Goodfellowiella coeruleoviolacea TaxID=334858 RepID=A0AAE3GKG2_9PSEU|nr:Helicase conserved C-terminal domain-containing protein [Goodfellowiella coeruleoviolacea]
MPWPDRLQATFVPAEHAVAFWGPLDLVHAHDLPEGRPGTCRFALPADGRVEPVDVPVRLVDLDTAVPALRALPARSAALGASVLAWRAAARLAEDGDPGELAARLPPAAHAVLNAEETAIMSARAALTRFHQAVATASALRATGLRATPRPYQVRGIAWLRALAAEGGGGVLADDMGLGKTLQAIGLLATRRHPDQRPHLVVCPTSLVGNWLREIQRFAPDTPVIGYHGARRALPEHVAAGTVVVTSYSVLRTDQALRQQHWDTAVFDEAQQLKNPDAQVSRAAAGLTAHARIAMTGTPVENRLTELWSILHVTNPGVLGSRARFRQRFAGPIEQRRSATAAARLNALVGPHLLRRTKSEVAADLPAKQHTTVACTLTAEQARLYTDAVDRAFATGLGSGIARRGRVLALLTALKQICNHPAQYLGENGENGENGERELVGRSGKFDRAVEMLAEIADQGDRALVFTQYRAMGELLCRQLTDTLGGDPVPFLHGGLSLARRDRLVHAFQTDDTAPPVLLLSLRAAGFGLNLTRASHVVHYDRWWNPAVEEQATDRAHRIGQQRTLTVHTLVTGGTIEDHIARLHQTKRALADVVSRDAEAALADLSDADLHSVLELNPGAIA